MLARLPSDPCPPATEGRAAFSSRQMARHCSALGPSKSKCRHSDVQSRRRPLSMFSPDWCIAGPWGGIKHRALLSGGSRRWRASRAVPMVPMAGATHGSVMAPRAAPPSPCRHPPRAETLTFQSEWCCGPVMAPLRRARKKWHQELGKNQCGVQCGKGCHLPALQHCSSHVELKPHFSLKASHWRAEKELTRFF